MTNKATTQPPRGDIGLSSAELLALCQSFNPGQDLDLAKTVQDALLLRFQQRGHTVNEWADMAVNGMQWVRNIKDGISTPEEALAGLQSDLVHCQAVQVNSDAALPGPGTTDLATPESPAIPSQEVDERAAWAADMIAAGAKHLGGECWEWDVDDFEFRLWQTARRHLPQTAPVASAPVGDERPVNPHVGHQDLAEAWQKGFDDEPPVLRAGRIYFDAYKEGQATRADLESAPVAGQAHGKLLPVHGVAGPGPWQAEWPRNRSTLIVWRWCQAGTASIGREYLRADGKITSTPGRFRSWNEAHAAIDRAAKASAPVADKGE